jgi:arabinofuranosyltransferase
MSFTRTQAPAPPARTPAAAPARRPIQPLAILGLAAIVLAIFALQLRHFWPFITDDAFISLRYSQRLLQGHGLTWNDMRPVEGYTNLLWVLACAALGALGIPLPAAAQGLGIACTLIGMAAVAAQVFRDYPAKIRFFSAALACAALALSGPIDVWALGGLEQPMLAALLAWAVYLGVRWVATSRPASRDTFGIGLLLAFACLTRADASLFAGAFFLGAVFADGLRIPTVVSRVRVLLLPFLFSLAQLFFRHFYYHEWLPNTAYVKVAFTLHRLRTGLKYDLIGVETDAAFLLLLLIGAAALWIAGKQRQVKFLLTILAVWLLYIVVIGGDIFPSVRHFIPVLVLGAFLVAGCGYLTLAAPFRFSRPRVAAFLVLLALVLVSDRFCHPETWEAQGKSIGLFLKQAFGRQHALLSSDAAGVVPFYSELPAIDPLGLNDYHIARHKSVERGRGWVGHELADGKYVLDHKPDLVIFSDFQSEPFLPADEEMLHDPRFAADYQPVRFDTNPPDAIRTIIYVRRLDGRIGIHQSVNQIEIPAYLADMNPANSVRLVNGQAQLVIPPHGSANFSAIPVVPGDWRIAPQGAGAPSIAVSDIPGAAPACSACLHVPRPETVSFSLRNNSDSPATLSEVDLSPTIPQQNRR